MLLRAIPSIARDIYVYSSVTNYGASIYTTRYTRSCNIVTYVIHTEHLYMALFNFKTFVRSCLEPSVRAIQLFYKNETEVITTRHAELETAIQRCEAHIVEQDKHIAELAEQIIDFTSQVSELQSKFYSSKDVQNLSTNVRRLELICQALYNIVRQAHPRLDMPEEPIPSSDSSTSTTTGS